jgi:sortase A
MHAKAELAGILVRRAWEQSVQSGRPRAPWPWADTHPVARIRIPRLGYDEIVLEGAAPRTLAFGPAHLLNGTAVGGPGNLVLAGHRTSWFRPLEGIAQGDAIQIQWFDSHHGGLQARTYTVNMVSVVGPEDTSLLAPTPDDALTLITCYPFGRGPRSPQRFIVRASPVETGRPVQRLGSGVSLISTAQESQFPQKTFSNLSCCAGSFGLCSPGQADAVIFKTDSLP